MDNFIKNGLTEANETIESVLSDVDLLNLLQNSIKCLSECYKNNGRVFSCGNGGSMCDSMHFAEELTGRFRKDRRSLGAMSISDPSHLTCVGNDYGYEHVFSRHLEGWGNPGDVLLAISTSGNSPNILEAVKVAKEKKMKVIGLLGKGGGKLKGEVDYPLIVPFTKSTDRVQEIHIKFIHLFIEGIERNLFPENY
tara:strand:- start:6161 stop:6745 length:585 start_codon:yes stop_codon:yes gene_type:complete